MTCLMNNEGTPVNGQKVAVLTDGANDIGKIHCRGIPKVGVKVYVIDKAFGYHYVGDISNKAMMEYFAEKVIRETGCIDYLINNAPPLMKEIDECSYEDFRYALAVGLTASFFLSKLFVRKRQVLG